MITTDEFGTKTVYPLCNGDAVALTTGPADLDLGDLDRDLTPAETDRLDVLLWLTPMQAVMLAQQLFDAATESLSLTQIEAIRASIARSITPAGSSATNEMRGTTMTDQPDPRTSLEGATVLAARDVTLAAYLLDPTRLGVGLVIDTDDGKYVVPLNISTVRRLGATCLDTANATPAEMASMMDDIEGNN